MLQQYKQHILAGNKTTYLKYTYGKVLNRFWSKRNGSLVMSNKWQILGPEADGHGSNPTERKV